MVAINFETEQSGSKPAKVWDFMNMFAKNLKEYSMADIEANFKSVNDKIYSKARVSEYRSAFETYSKIPGGLEALKAYTRFVETDRGCQGIMALGCLYNNKELDLCDPDVQAQIVSHIHGTCKDEYFTPVVKFKGSFTPAAKADWQVLNSGPSLIELCFRLRMRAKCRSQVTEVILGGQHDSVSILTFNLSLKPYEFFISSIMELLTLPRR